MSEPKPLASLSPSLLARKGGARPAMRPQLAPLAIDMRPHQFDDLGWNDMGHDEPEPVQPVILAEAPPPPVVAVAEVVALEPEAAIPAPSVPEVVRQQEDVARRIAQPRRSALESGRRAAFTLRVDAERHLKLRLACAVRNRSAQQLVTEALDRLLDDLPDIAALAAQVAGKRR